jgi:hypothetical protein
MALSDWQRIEAQKALIIRGEVVIPTTWCLGDVVGQAKNDEVYITYEQALDVLQQLKRQLDNSVGITWDTLSTVIRDVGTPYADLDDSIAHEDCRWQWFDARGPSA